MLPSESFPPPKAACGMATLSSLIAALQESNEAGSKDGLTDIFHPVGIHCRISPDVPLEGAAELIKKEMDAVKVASNDQGPYSVFVGGLDGRIGQAQKFVTDLANLCQARVYVKIAEDILAGARIMVDRVLHCSPSGEEVTLQLGVPDNPERPMSLLAFEQTPDGAASPLALVSYKRNTTVELKRTNSMDMKRRSDLGEDVRVGVMPVPVWSDDTFANGEFYQSYPLRVFIAEHVGEGEHAQFNVQRADFGREKEIAKADAAKQGADLGGL